VTVKTRLIKASLFLLTVWLNFEAGLCAAAEITGPRLKIGLALSGGGAKGLVHVGVLKVLEEAGIKVDYIAGTSMGSQIGALYAIGYSASSIEKIVTEQNWEELLNDRISRKDISIEAKREDGRYVSTFPIREGKIAMPKGLAAGQKISLLISRLTLPVHHVHDFRGLPIPFLCIATDLETGEAVVLDKGFLPDALRASMSIPTVFTPVELDGRLLVDGGLVRNFPVSDVREMGADIVIGVDVGAPLYKREKLNSLVKITEQSINFRGAASTRQQQALCDILITPDIKEFGMLSFNATDTLIARGERAARKMMPQLKALADSINRNFSEEERPAPLKPPDRFYVTELEFEGLKNVSKNLLLAKLQTKIPSLMTSIEIEKAIGRAYGTGFFERVTYKMEPGQAGTRLVIRVVEQGDDVFRFGINYDSDLKSSILLNTTFRNHFIDGSKLSISAKLSENPAFEGYYLILTDWNPGIGLRMGTEYMNMDVLVYSNKGEIDASIDYHQYTTNIMLQTIFSQSSDLSAGIQFSHTLLKMRIAPPGWLGGSYNLLNLFTAMRIDSFDRTIYPRSGISLLARARLVKDLSNPIFQIQREAGNPISSSYINYMLKFSGAFPANEKLSFLGSFFGGISTEDLVPDDYRFYLGGAYPHIDTSFPFMGLNFLERVGSQALAVQAGIQYEFMNNKFITIKANAGKTTDNLDDLFNKKDILTGVGMSLGALTPIGPLEYTLMWGSEKDDLISNINIGYRF